MQKLGLLTLWKEECAKAKVAWPECLRQMEAEMEAEAAEEAAAEAAEAALEERDKATLDQVTIKRDSQKKRKRRTPSTPHDVTPPQSRSTLILQLLQVVEEAGDAPNEQLVDQLRSSLKDMELNQLGAPRPRDEGPGAALD